MQLVAKSKASHSGGKVFVVFVMRTLTRTQLLYDHESTGQSHGYEKITFGFGDDMMISFTLSAAIGKILSKTDLILLNI